MKNLFFLSIFSFIFTNEIISQTNSFPSDGNVGIGITNPNYLLHAKINGTEPTISIHNAGGIGGAAFNMIDENSNSFWKFKSFYVNGGGFKIRDQNNSIDVVVIENNSAANAILIKQGGKIGIGGQTNPRTKLDVLGTIACDSIVVDGLVTSREVKVRTDVWPDYVFNNNYKLMPLSEVERYIVEYKHLPGIPSEREVMKEGINVGEMNKLLLEKIEELTLHLINLQKQIDILKRK